MINTTQAKEIFIPDFLGQLGHLPKKITATEYLYNSPIRQEKTPSFWVNLKRNVFMDFGLNTGGSLIDLAMLYINSNSVSDGLKFIDETMREQSFSFSQQKDVLPDIIDKDIELRKVAPLQNSALLNYLKDERFISEKTAMAFCKELYYRIGNKNYFCIGFKNRSKGWATRNKFFKGCLGKADVSFIDNGKNILYVFEGFISWLSYLEAGFEPATDQNYLILNSIANYSKAATIINRHCSLFLYLDNDQAGRSLTQQILTDYPKSIDCASGYAPYNDLNEWWKAHKQGCCSSILSKLAERI